MPRLVIAVRPGARTKNILAWLRQLVPAAILVVAAADVPPAPPSDAIALDDDDVVSGPLSLADALLRHRAAADPDPAPPSEPRGKYEVTTPLTTGADEEPGS